MSAPDYHPIEPGLRLEYELRRAQGVERLVLEYLDGGRLRRTWSGPDGAEASVERVERREDGVYHAGELVLPLPPALGRRWELPPRSCWVAALDAAVETPAGRFEGCARVAYLIAGGDAGSGERLYAPGVGLVYEACREEADPYETRLLSLRRGKEV